MTASPSTSPPAAAPCEPGHPAISLAQRAEALLLAKRGSPYDFLPRALALLARVPDDHELRLLTASAFLRLGLHTAAKHHADLLPPATPRRGELIDAIAALPDDRLPIDTLETRIQSALRTLEARGMDVAIVRGAIPIWQARAAEQVLFRCADGNIARWSEHACDWTRLADEKRAAKAPLAAMLGTDGTSMRGGAKDASNTAASPAGKPPPVYVEGFDPPWLVHRLLDERPVQADGYAPRVVVIQEDPAEFLAGLALADQTMLAHPGLELVIGPGASAELERRLATRLDCNLGEICLEVPGTATRAPGLHDALARATAAQLAQARHDAATSAERYRPRDRAWWSARYAQAGFRPRVLIPTTRYSTFIRHSSADIAAALRDWGCDVRVLDEPDSSSCLTTAGFARAVANFEPDLVILINYTRRLAGAAIPANLPFVCWVQDAMPHLFTTATGSAQGPFDFLVGHLHWAFFETFGYPRARGMGLPVLASRRKFAPKAPSQSEGGEGVGGGRCLSDAQRFTCDVACVTHHSETPEQFRDRMIREAGSGSGSGGNAGGAHGTGVVEQVYDALVHIAADPLAETLASRVKRATEDALRAAGLVADPARVTGVAMSIAWPLLDRLLRHQTLHWTAEIARRRNWRFHLYGRGWANHPTLGAFDQGELAHGTALRTAYRSAAAHLHVSPHTNLHQRVMECALAGGLPLCRLTLDWVCQLGGFAASNLAAAGAPMDHVSPCPVPCAWTADHWSSMALVAQVQRLGLAHANATRFHVNDHAMPWNGARVPILESVQREPWFYNAGEPISPDVAWLLGDLCESTFWDQATLEARLERAIKNPAWREDLMGGIRGRVDRALTYESAVARIVGLVENGLR